MYEGRERREDGLQRAGEPGGERGSELADQGGEGGDEPAERLDGGRERSEGLPDGG
jgi:hypothetical protein